MLSPDLTPNTGMRMQARREIAALTSVFALIAACMREPLDGNTDSTSATSFDPETRTCQLGDQEVPLDDEIEWPDACTRWQCTETGLVQSWQAPSVIPATDDVNVSTPEHIAALACIADIQGTLLIGNDAQPPTSTVTSLVGLDKLGHVGVLRIVNNPMLTSLQGLSGLYEITGTLEIRGNAELSTPEGFSSSLIALGGVSIVDNDGLTSLRGLEFLGGCTTCEVRNSESEIDAFADQTRKALFRAPPEGDATGGGDVAESGLLYGSLDITDNDVLVDTSAISTLRIVLADVLLRRNAALADLAGFVGLHQVDGNLEISQNIALPGTLAQEAGGRMTIAGTTTICGNLGDPLC